MNLSVFGKLPHILCVSALLFTQSACSSDHPDDGRFEVSVVGQGVVNAEPDHVTINAHLRLQGEQSLALLQQANQTVATVLEALDERGIKAKHIQAGQLRLNQRWQHRSGKQEPMGYEAVRSLRISLKDIERYPEIIDLLFAQGVNTLSGVEFGFSKQQELQDEALELASKDAMRQAKLLGKAMGGSDCRPEHIGLGGAAVPMPRMEMAAMRSHDSAKAYNPGELAVTASVNATFSCR